MRKVYKNIAISCKAKDLLEEIAKYYEGQNKAIKFQRSDFVEELIKEEHKKLITK